MPAAIESFARLKPLACMLVVLGCCSFLPTAPAWAEDAAPKPLNAAVDALNDEAAVQACLAKLKAGTFDAASSPSGFQYADEGPLNCTQGTEKSDDHRKFAVIGVTAHAPDGMRLTANGDFVDRDSMTVYQSGDPLITLESGTNSYTALVGKEGLEAYDPETDGNKAGAVEQGPVFGTGGERKLVMIKDLPEATQQALTNTQAAAIKTQAAFIAAIADSKR